VVRGCDDVALFWPHLGTVDLVLGCHVLSIEVRRSSGAFEPPDTVRAGSSDDARYSAEGLDDDFFLVVKVLQGPCQGLPCFSRGHFP